MNVTTTSQAIEQPECLPRPVRIAAALLGDDRAALPLRTRHSGVRTGCKIFQPKLSPSWTVEHFPIVDTTQSVARSRAAWSAVTADVQSAGRGQKERTFVSDLGGLYLTAVLPYSGDALAMRGFALAVGWAVRTALRQAGVSGLRLRWPNDLMIGTRKVGGILVEQGERNTLLVGIGLNVTNRPWLSDSTLIESAGCLADLSLGEGLPARDDLAKMLLRAIGSAHRVFARKRLTGLVPWLNRSWGGSRCVRLELVPGVGVSEIEGDFVGIGPTGDVLLRMSHGTPITVAERYINRLVELPTDETRACLQGPLESVCFSE